MKSKKTIIFIISILAIAAGAWWYFKMRKPEETGSTASGAAGTLRNNSIAPPNKSAAPPNFGNDNIPLRIGSKGPKVAVLQKHLNKVMNAKLAVDGEFGNATLNALKAKYNTVSVDQWSYDNVYSKNI